MNWDTRVADNGHANSRSPIQAIKACHTDNFLSHLTLDKWSAHNARFSSDVSPSDFIQGRTQSESRSNIMVIQSFLASCWMSWCSFLLEMDGFGTAPDDLVSGTWIRGFTMDLERLDT